MNRPVIGIPLGDPSGIGPEIALKAQLNPEIDRCCIPVLVGPSAVAEAALRRFRIPIRLRPLPQENLPVVRPDPGTVWMLDTGAFNLDGLQYGCVQAPSGQAAHDAIRESVAQALAGRFSAIATTPLNK